MNTYIKKLRSKPEEDRKKILYLWTMGSMIIVVFIWVYGLTTRFSTTEIVAESSNELKPFELFVNSIKGSYSKMTASAGDTDVAEVTKPVPENNTVIDLIPTEANY